MQCVYMWVGSFEVAEMMDRSVDRLAGLEPLLGLELIALEVLGFILGVRQVRKSKTVDNAEWNLQARSPFCRLSCVL
jgi:F0F1-type ATP synthase assembly protein I